MGKKCVQVANTFCINLFKTITTPQSTNMIGEAVCTNTSIYTIKKLFIHKLNSLVSILKTHTLYPVSTIPTITTTFFLYKKPITIGA